MIINSTHKSINQPIKLCQSRLPHRSEVDDRHKMLMTWHINSYLKKITNRVLLDFQIYYIHPNNDKIKTPPLNQPWRTLHSHESQCNTFFYTLFAAISSKISPLITKIAGQQPYLYSLHHSVCTVLSWPISTPKIRRKIVLVHWHTPEVQPPPGVVITAPGHVHRGTATARCWTLEDGNRRTTFFQYRQLCVSL